MADSRKKLSDFLGQKSLRERYVDHNVNLNRYVYK